MPDVGDTVPVSILKDQPPQTGTIDSIHETLYTRVMWIKVPLGTATAYVMRTQDLTTERTTSD